MLEIIIRCVDSYSSGTTDRNLVVAGSSRLSHETAIFSIDDEDHALEDEDVNRRDDLNYAPVHSSGDGGSNTAVELQVMKRTDVGIG